MKYYLFLMKVKHRFSVLQLLIFTLIVSVACGTTDPITPSPIPTPPPTVAPPPSATVAPTATAAAPATPSPPRYGAAGLGPELLATPAIAAAVTAASERFDAHQTAVALTPIPPTEVWIPPTPEPTATMGVGMMTDTGCTFPRHFAAPFFTSCWHTNVNGAWMLVGSGQEGTSQPIQKGMGGDLHGLIWVCTEPCYGPDPQPNQLYPAPRPDLHITAVDGARITLASRDPAVPDIFVFDIVTHQWVNP